MINDLLRLEIQTYVKHIKTNINFKRMKMFLSIIILKHVSLMWSK